MFRRASQTFVLIAACLVRLHAQPAGAAALRDARAALERQDFTSAEARLRAELKARPAEAEALSLLGMALDGQNKFTEAADFHHRAIAAAPRSATILARYGTHLFNAGDEKGARDTFLKALALDPADRYANLQMAQWAVRQKDTKNALTYLNRITASQQNDPEVLSQRLIALDLSADPAATPLFGKLSALVEKNAALGASTGWSLAQAGQFDQAETFLTHAYAADPSDFHVLYDLGVVALYAGHYDHARDFLETAVRRQPENVDALYSLGFAESTLRHPEPAIRALAEAARLAPARADVQRLLAVTANELRAYEDAAAAWDRYSQLAPNDDEAKRERGYANIHRGKFEAGIADLDWYVKRHPDDPMGHFELGVGLSASDPTQGIADLDKALALKPDFLAARAVRGNLYYKQGKPETALPDLEAAAAQSGDSVVLDHLGQTYVALDRLPDAIRTLRKAADMPGEPTVLLHLANALAQAGANEESEALIARYKQARPVQGPVGLLPFLSLTPEQQRADYRARVEKAVKDNPGDSGAQSRYLKLLLEENQMDQAAVTARLIAGLKPGSVVLADAGRALLEARQYVPAKELLEQAGGTGVDLAIATFHALGGTAPAAAEGLRQLDRAPEANRDADYYLARAQMLDAAGKTAEALSALSIAIRADSRRADLYWQYAMLLTRNKRGAEALQMLDQTAKALPTEPAIPLIKAAVLELSGRTDEAHRVLDDVQRNWPEGAGVWVARGIILAVHRRFDEARRALETAATHGARSAEAWFALADATMRSAPDRIDDARAAIAQASRLAPDDAAIRDMASSIASGKGNFANLTPVNPLRLFENKPPRDW